MSLTWNKINKVFKKVYNERAYMKAYKRIVRHKKSLESSADEPVSKNYKLYPEDLETHETRVGGKN